MIFRVACLAAITIPVIAQTAAFEAVSIKPAAPDSHGETRRYPGGRFTATGITVKALIQRAWDVKDFQITGGPELDQMIQSMLRDRFRLEIHRETKDMPIYSLMVAKSGPKLTPTTATMQTWSRGNGSLVGTKVPIDMLAGDLLESQLRRVVVDHTGIAGNFHGPVEMLVIDRAEKPSGN